MRLGKSVAANSLSKYKGTLPDAPAASSKERSRHFPGAQSAVWRVSAWCCLEGLQAIWIHMAGVFSISSRISIWSSF